MLTEITNGEMGYSIETCVGHIHDFFKYYAVILLSTVSIFIDVPKILTPFFFKR